MSSVEARTASQQIEQLLISSNELTIPGCEELTYTDLFDRYASSPFGATQAQQPARYSNRYAYDRDTMIADLGDDVHPLRHMPYTETKIFRPLIAYQHHPQERDRGTEQLSQLEIVAGRLGSLLHDIGECEHPELAAVCGGTVGDVNLFEKTTEHEGIEALIRGHFYKRFFSDVPQDVLELAEDMIANNSGTLLRDAFATTERLGYFMTGINAGLKAIGVRFALPPGTCEEDDRFLQLRRLALETAPRWYDELLERGERFPWAGSQTLARKTTLDRIQSELAA